MGAIVRTTAACFGGIEVSLATVRNLPIAIPITLITRGDLARSSLARGNGIGKTARLAASAAILVGIEGCLAAIGRLIVTIVVAGVARFDLARPGIASSGSVVERTAGRDLIAATAVFDACDRSFATVLRITIAISKSILASHGGADTSRARGFAISGSARLPTSAAIGQRIDRCLATIR